MGIYKQPGSPYWYVRYSYQGQAIRESTKTTSRRVAENMLAARKADIARGVFKLADIRPGPLFRDFAERYFEHVKGYKRSWQRDRTSLGHLCEAFGAKRLEQVAQFDAECYRQERKGQVSPASVNRELACLKHLFNKAIEWGEAEGNPVKGVKLFRETPRERFLSLEEEDALLEACSPDLRPIVLTALMTGMRIGELLALGWDDVDFGRGLITVRTSKNGERRLIPMAPSLTEALRTFKLQRTGDVVFSKADGQPRRGVRTPFTTACRRAGIEGLRFHDLRHTFASNLGMAGVDLPTLQRLVGHKTIQMTMRYAHVRDDHMREAVGMLDERRTSIKLAYWPAGAAQNSA